MDYADKSYLQGRDRKRVASFESASDRAVLWALAFVATLCILAAAVL